MLFDLAVELYKQIDIRLEFINLSGGIGIPYHPEEQPVDLVLLDMIMPPGIDGLDTFQEIRSVNPNQKAVLVSGYSENERVREALDLGIGAYLKKPYTIEQMSQVITMELGR